MKLIKTATEAFNDQNALANFDLIAQHLADNTAYLPRDVWFLRKLFNEGMKKASSEVTKEQFVHTLAGVIERLAAVNGNGTLAICERPDIRALGKLSKALFKRADASMIPPDFASHLEQTALEVKGIAQSRPDLQQGIAVATRALNKKAKVLDSIAARVNNLTIR